MQCSPAPARLLTPVGGLCAGTCTSGWRQRGGCRSAHFPHDQPAASHTARSAMDWDGVQDCGAFSFASWLILLARCVWRVHPQQHSRLESSGAGRGHTKSNESYISITYNSKACFLFVGRSDSAHSCQQTKWGLQRERQQRQQQLYPSGCILQPLPRQAQHAYIDFAACQCKGCMHAFWICGWQ
jgi:hypothetical protein